MIMIIIILYQCCTISRLTNSSHDFRIILLEYLRYFLSLYSLSLSFFFPFSPSPLHTARCPQSHIASYASFATATILLPPPTFCVCWYQLGVFRINTRKFFGFLMKTAPPCTAFLALSILLARSLPYTRVNSSDCLQKAAPSCAEAFLRNPL